MRANAEGAPPDYAQLHAQLREAYAPILQVQASITAQLEKRDGRRILTPPT